MTQSLRATMFALALALTAPLAAGPLLVQSLGNEGFLLTSESQSVLIDGLYRGLDGYVAPEADELDNRARAQGRYRAVTLALASHHHGDHFDATVVARHLRHNERAIFVSTDQAVSDLREAADDFGELSDRVIAAAPTAEAGLTIDDAPCPLVALNLHHGVRDPPVSNVGFLVELDGTRVLHMGDTEVTPDEIGHLGLARKKIDVVFMPFWLLTGPGHVAAFKNVLGRSTTIVAMHLPAANADPSYFGPPGSLPPLEKSLRKLGVVVLAPGEELRLAGGS